MTDCCPLVGTYLLAAGQGTQYGPQIARQGNACHFLVNIIAWIGTPSSVLISVEHKNSKDTTWGTLVSFSAATGTGLIEADASGIKEQLRFAYMVTTPAPPSASNDWMGCQFNKPGLIWRPY